MMFSPGRLIRTGLDESISVLSKLPSAKEKELTDVDMLTACKELRSAPLRSCGMRFSIFGVFGSETSECILPVHLFCCQCIVHRYFNPRRASYQLES